MINFYRNIRKQLANENKFQRYFRYAFGEVVLIMLGIFMALQLQNWNEQRKQEAQFKVTLEQLYTSIKYDAEAFYRHSIIFRDHISTIDSLLDYPDAFPDKELPYVFDFLTFNGRPYTTESVYYSKDLTSNPSNVKQKELAKEILNYINSIDDYNYNIDERLEKAIRDIDIPIPKIDLGNVMGDYDRSDSTYFDASDLMNTHNLLRSHKFRAILKNARAFNIWNYAESRNRSNDGLSIRNLIKEYFPEVKVFYKDVGIIGTSIDGFDDIGAKSTPLKLTDEDHNIWELDLYLKVGKVKFRCRDSWTQNWGSDTFPKGVGMQDGGDIPVSEAGNYHIIFKPVTGEYEFIKQDD